MPGGIGGTDNLCVGDTSTLASTDGTVTASRTGENQTVGFSGFGYVMNTNTYNNYTIALSLPFPPVDPNNPLQCACNADPTNPYRCVYTNQQPGQGLTNFFVKTGITNTAWFQTLGGSSWASGNIESKIPFTTCTPPTCIPALIARDPEGNTDSAGFPLTDTGSVITSDTGGIYIHESGGRSNALQAEALGVSVPVENYDYFFNKFGGQAQTLPNAGKPIVGDTLAVYKYSGDLTIDNTNSWSLTNTEQIIVFVDGDLTIDDTPSGENRLTTVASGGDGFLMFIASGNIIVTSDVGYDNIYTNPAAANIANVEGVFIADGTLTIAGQTGVTDRKFIGAGTYVGWSGVILERNFDDGDSPELNNDAATEVFIFRPDFIVNAPRPVKSAQMTWREVEPQF